MPTLVEVGLLLKATDQMTSVVRAATRATGRELSGLAQRARAVGDWMQGAGRGALGTGLVMAGALRAPIRSFVELQDASTRLKVAMTGAGGAVSEHFAAVDKLAVRLGNKLPGTTKDFQHMMEVLVSQGVPAQAILDGVGASTANLAVLLKQPYDETARFAARLREATGVASSDMLAFMDTIQRTAHLGVSTQEMGMAFGRSAGMLKQMELQGLDAAKSMSALYAILIKTNMSGETAGTNMSAVLGAFQSADKVAQANRLLAEFGIELDFVDQATGRFRGIENMVAQLDQLQALNPAELQRVLSKVFGPGQDAQIVATLISNGIGGYNDVIDRMSAQASLQTRVTTSLQTLGAQWEAASGTWENAMAAWTQAAAPTLLAAAQAFGAFSEKMQAWSAAHPVLARGAFLVAAGIATMLVLLGALGLAAGAALRSVANITEATSKMARVLRASALRGRGAVVSLATSLRTGLVFGFRAAAFAARALALALVANPIGAIIAGVLAVGAFLVYRFWEPIKAFFAGLWQGLEASLSAIGEAFAPVRDAALELWAATRPVFEPLLQALEPVRQALGWVADRARDLWDWMSRLFTPVRATAEQMDGAADAGRSVGRVIGQFVKGAIRVLLTPLRLMIQYWTRSIEAIGAFIDWVSGLPGKVGGAFDQVVGFAAGLPSRFYEAGKNIVLQIVQGIKDMAHKAIEAVQELARKVRDFFPFSPARRGPLRDLHRMRLVETIASSIRESPLLERVQRLAAAASTTLSSAMSATPFMDRLRSLVAASTMVVAATAVPSAAAAPAPAAAAARQAVVVHFNPTIHVAGGSSPAETRQAVTSAMRQSEQELERMLERIETRRQRRAY